MPPNQRSVRAVDIEDTVEEEVFPMRVVAAHIDNYVYQLVTLKVESGNYI